MYVEYNPILHTIYTIYIAAISAFNLVCKQTALPRFVCVCLSFENYIYFHYRLLQFPVLYLATIII